MVKEGSRSDNSGLLWDDRVVVCALKKYYRRFDSARPPHRLASLTLPARSAPLSVIGYDRSAIRSAISKVAREITRLHWLDLHAQMHFIRGQQRGHALWMRRGARLEMMAKA